MRLSLARLNWTMEQPIGAVDDLGAPYSFALTSPALLKKVLRESSRRFLEREAGQKYAQRNRSRYDIVLEGSSSKKFSDLDKGCIRACLLQRNLAHGTCCGSWASG